MHRPSAEFEIKGFFAPLFGMLSMCQKLSQCEGVLAASSAVHVRVLEWCLYIRHACDALHTRARAPTSRPAPRPGPLLSAAAAAAVSCRCCSQCRSRGVRNQAVPGARARPSCARARQRLSAVRARGLPQARSALVGMLLPQVCLACERSFCLRQHMRWQGGAALRKLHRPSQPGGRSQARPPAWARCCR
jgi:hypothetical protein